MDGPPSRDDLVAQLREIAGRLNTTRMSRARWLQEGGPGQHHVFKYFDSWTAFVEGVGTGFPDCEAKRCVSRAGDVWERVRIEFEFKSGNFLAHGHDPAGCDVLVCWEHNWPDCPVEVLELRTTIDELEE